MDTSLSPVQFEAFLQSTIGVMWSFAILAIVTAAGWLVKIYLEYWKGRKLHDQETRYQMGRDLLASRFESFEDLWARMANLAIYTSTPFDAGDAKALADDLSAWYFSAKGGLYLTVATRNFYFALQHLLVETGRRPDWRCPRRPSDPRALFDSTFGANGLKFNLSAPTAVPADAWQRYCETELTAELLELVESQDAESGARIYAALQQVSSVLRSNLAAELQSRLDVDRPQAEGRIALRA